MPRKKVPVNIAMYKPQTRVIVMIPHAGYRTLTSGLLVVRALYWDKKAGEFKVDTARCWRIVHQASGQRVGLDFGTLGDAAMAAKRLGSLGDWTVSVEELVVAMPVAEVREVLYGA